jgi:hypothetical protein
VTPAPYVVQSAYKDVVNKIAHLIDKGFHIIQPFHGQSRLAVRIDGIGNAAHGQILNMRCLTSEYGHHFVDISLIFQGLKEMMGCQQIDLRRKFHGRVPPVSTGENTQLA